MTERILNRTIVARRSENSKEPLQVRIPVGIKRQFKARAALLGIEPNELFVEVWQHYEQARELLARQEGANER